MRTAVPGAPGLRPAKRQDSTEGCASRVHAQSYGIKVGYGAGGSAAGTVRPGEAAPAKSSSCC
jgi:hypothetical protein